ncbi:MAG: Homogentisate 1,2-dioxygenase [Verrucomicrobia subdivision 3 bacterium]|nr:Homogentisate 1,2-dioxygenase [Limisphaerales bacterium]
MKPSWIHIKRGKTTRQARNKTIGKFNEELFGRFGFAGQVAMLYHKDSPTEVIRVEGDSVVGEGVVLNAPTEDSQDERGDFLRLLENQDVTVGVSRRAEAMPYCYRNTIGDLLYFVHKGTGTFATEFGPIEYEPGDYVLLPKGTTFRLFPDSKDNLFYVVQSVSRIGFTEHVQVGRHVPFDPSLITIPDVVDYDWDARDEWELLIKHRTGFTSVFYENCPMDLVGWKGDLFPFKINIRDIIPIESTRTHLAPSSWSTFENENMMIVTFLPQHAVQDLESEELPSNHRNIDCEEIIFIHDHPHFPVGSVLHLPQSLMHGTPKDLRDTLNAARTKDDKRQLWGVSVDTYRPVTPTAAYRKLCEQSKG